MIATHYEHVYNHLSVNLHEIFCSVDNAPSFHHFLHIFILDNAEMF